jgi:predicted amidophosphoribosyltransferase
MTAMDTVLPPRCPGCGAITATLHAFCGDCWARLAWLPDPHCARCAEPLPAGAPPGECLGCLADPPAFSGTQAVMLYEGLARELVLRCKNGAEHLAEPLGYAMRKRAHAWLDGAVLVPVPLHPTRLAKRRYNQSGWLARVVARGMGAEVELDWLVRRRATPSFAAMNRAGRLREALGAYAVPPAARAAVRGAHVVLIDDVMTTGATLRAAARPLKRAGAASVQCLVFARVARGRARPQ